ncbi:DUF1906 domain-containing protein [Clostridium aestuarii]|uniref:DUF1906 domain-containing protein n=1 Tax=Clostridium aestuarii TaxID=338193 RepID=A0ABT4D2C1_9CLOT|nr:glycoside hydrolase domain-containing protein [Clostridium aestuarii]MCY6485379.1 DUF1906 domain-containing protein [Clostridium aestuarii]
MNRPILFEGVDVAVPLTFAQCKTLKDVGYRFVCRYYTDYSDPKQMWKLISKDEAIMISKAGLDIIAIYELGGRGNKTYSKETGKKDCINAIRCAEKIGQPSNTTIYFAVDSGVKLNYGIECISNYFEGINEQMKLYKNTSDNEGWNLGIYGSYYVIEYMHNRCGIVNYWQTAAWSETKISDKADFMQYILNISAHGIYAIDMNISYTPILGQFRI